MTFTYTPEQAEKIAARWNDLANDRNQISASDVHNVFGDSADDEVATRGETLVEMRASHSASGAPATFYVTEDDVTVERITVDLSSWENLSTDALSDLYGQWLELNGYDGDEPVEYLLHPSRAATLAPAHREFLEEFDRVFTAAQEVEDSA